MTGRNPKGLHKCGTMEASTLSFSIPV